MRYNVKLKPYAVNVDASNEIEALEKALAEVVKNPYIIPVQIILIGE